MHTNTDFCHLITYNHNHVASVTTLGKVLMQSRVFRKENYVYSSWFVGLSICEQLLKKLQKFCVNFRENLPMIHIQIRVFYFTFQQCAN